MKKLVVVAALACCAGTLATRTTPRQADWQGRLDRALRTVADSPATTPVRVVVRTRTGREGAVEHRLAASGAHDLHAISSDLLAARITAGMLRTVAVDPDVTRLSLDAPLQSAGTSTTLLSSNTLLGTEGLLPRSYTGKGVGVAIVDSGLVISADVGNVTASYSFLSGKPVKQGPKDAFGHGTHVAGLVSSTGSTTKGQYQGIAPGANLIILRALGDDGAGLTSNVIQAINFAVANKKAFGIDVLNLSLGHPIYEPAATDPLVQAVENAVANGIVVVVSAGNFGGDPVTHVTGYGGITSPGNAPSAITVGAVETHDTVGRGDDSVTWYSSRGPTWYDGFQKPDLVAAGGHLASNVGTGCSLAGAYPKGLIKTSGTCSLMRLSGTSMAAAVVTGSVAVMIEANRAHHPGAGLTPNTVKAILQYTSLPIANEETLTQGAGSLNVAGAVTLAAAVDPGQPSGSSWVTEGINEYTQIGDEQNAWSQRIVWGDRVIWGNQIYYNDPAWAQRIIWGNRVIWGNRIIWGSSTVWDGNQITWGSRIIWGSSLLGQTLASGDINWGSLDSQTEANRVIWGNLQNLNIASSSVSWSNLERSNMDIK